jgi:hypothetical protein
MPIVIVKGSDALLSSNSNNNSNNNNNNKYLLRNSSSTELLNEIKDKQKIRGEAYGSAYISTGNEMLDVLNLKVYHSTAERPQSKLIGDAYYKDDDKIKSNTINITNNNNNNSNNNNTLSNDNNNNNQSTKPISLLQKVFYAKNLKKSYSVCGNKDGNKDDKKEQNTFIGITNELNHRLKQAEGGKSLFQEISDDGKDINITLQWAINYVNNNESSLSDGLLDLDKDIESFVNDKGEKANVKKMNSLPRGRNPSNLIKTTPVLGNMDGVVQDDTSNNKGESDPSKSKSVSLKASKLQIQLDKIQIDQTDKFVDSITIESMKRKRFGVGNTGFNVPGYNPFHKSQPNNIGGYSSGYNTSGYKPHPPSSSNSHRKFSLLDVSRNQVECNKDKDKENLTSIAELTSNRADTDSPTTLHTPSSPNKDALLKSKLSTLDKKLRSLVTKDSHTITRESRDAKDAISKEASEIIKSYSKGRKKQPTVANNNYTHENEENKRQVIASFSNHEPTRRYNMNNSSQHAQQSFDKEYKHKLDVYKTQVKEVSRLEHQFDDKNIISNKKGNRLLKRWYLIIFNYI